MIQMGGYITTKMKIPPVLAISTYVILKGPPYSDRNGTTSLKIQIFSE